MHVFKSMPDGYLETELGRRHYTDSLPNEINETVSQPHKSLDIYQLRQQKPWNTAAFFKKF